MGVWSVQSVVESKIQAARQEQSNAREQSKRSSTVTSCEEWSDTCDFVKCKSWAKVSKEM